MYVEVLCSLLGPLVYKYDCCIIIELVVCFAIKREVSELLISASATDICAHESCCVWGTFKYNPCKNRFP